MLSRLRRLEATTVLADSVSAGHFLGADGLLLPVSCMVKGRGDTDPIVGAPPHDQSPSKAPAS